MSLQGKVIALTGGASGIGLETAKLLAAQGATLSIADIDSRGLAETEQFFNSQGHHFLFTKVDVSSRADVDGWIQATVEKLGKLDAAANCAGTIGTACKMTSVEDTDDVEWDRTIAVNLTGMMYCLRAQLKHLEGGGSIVNVSSAGGVIGLPYMSHYVASKHGVIGLTRSAAKEVGQRNIRINAVVPGAIDTPLSRRGMSENQDIFGPDGGGPSPQTAFNRMGRPEEVAKCLVWLLGPDSSFVTGAVYSVDGGWLC